MILHPGILALMVGSAVTSLMLLYAVVIGTTILLRWDFGSSSVYQLTLERRTYLISTMVNYGLAFQIASFILFIYTMDDIHRLFVGAMCATGSLNANTIGWYALISKIVLFFLSGFWIALNYIDQLAEDYPLVKLKYWLLFGLVPVVGLDFVLQIAYFSGLEPDIITSCCGSLFGGGDGMTVSSLSALPVLPMMIVFYGCFLLFVLIVGMNLQFTSALLRYLLFLLASFFFLVSVASVISFVSIYIYELPTHHCPFDILQKGYYFIGYPLYITLFCGVYFGMLPGLFQPLKMISSLHQTILTVEKKWLQWALFWSVMYVVLVTCSIYFSRLVYFS